MIAFKPVRLAVYFDQRLGAGGGYQQALNAALLVRGLPLDQVTPFYFVRHSESLATLKQHGIDSTWIKLSFLSKIFLKIRRQIKNEAILKFIKSIFGPNQFEKYFLKKQIDLVYFLSPSPEAADLEELNYVITVWDLCFREHIEFPEVRALRAFENRNILFQQVLPKATAILADSDLGKVNLFKYFGVNPERIHVMPFMPAYAISENQVPALLIDNDVSKKFQINTPFIFYPAQFWAHKNHAYILYGLKLLESLYGKNVSAIFCGEDKGNLQHIKNLTSELGLDDRIRFAGFIENHVLISLYKQALALVMPTYFGPTNLPPYEAFSLGTPVLYSDEPGLRTQVEGAGLLMDLTDPHSLAKHLNNLMENKGLALTLIQEGYDLVSKANLYDRAAVLMKIIQDFRCKRATWA